MVEDAGTLSLPPSLFTDNRISQTKTGIFFSFYETAVLFPLKNTTENDTIDIGSSVIGATVAGVVAKNLDDPVMIALQVHLQVSASNSVSFVLLHVIKRVHAYEISSIPTRNFSIKSIIKLLTV